ncbi:unnamed protein product [Rhizoctonia solani]|nr:unnamed protein product [Rhizoctonia solani]
MKFPLFGLLSLLGMSWGFNIDASAIRAAEASELGETPHFGNITIPGQMEPTKLVFPDGLRLLLYSPNAQNVSVEKKDQPSAPAGFVTPLDSTAVSLGSGFWTAIYNYSWSIAFEAKDVDDIVSTIEVPYDSGVLESLRIRHENTFLGRFDSARGGWVVDISRSSVDSTQNRTRIIGLPNLGGEYMLLGRKSMDSHSNFIQPGSSSDLSDFIIEDPPADSQGRTDPSKAPTQIGTWIGGFQLEVRSCTKMRVNMNFFNSSEVKIQKGFKAVSSYGYMLNSSEANSRIAVIARLPLRPSQVKAYSLKGSRLQVAQLDPASGEFRVAHQTGSNATSTLRRIQFLSRFVEIEGSSLNLKWLLVASDASSSASSVTPSPSLAITVTPLPKPEIADIQALTTSPLFPSSTIGYSNASSATSTSSAIPVIVEILAVDRSVIKDRDIAFILDSLPVQPEARIDQQSYRPYIGIDLFYGKDGNAKGLVFVIQSRALVVRIPDNAAKTSAERYEKKRLEKPQDKPPISRHKGKGQKQAKALPEKTPYERLRQLLDLNLAAFGMAQVSLTLWDTLRERVEGINLSTITSKPEPPPSRAIPDPNSAADNGPDENSGEGTEKGWKKAHKGSRGGKGGQRGRGGRGGRRGDGRGRGGGRNNGDKRGDSDSDSEKKPKMISVPALPEDRDDCWDRLPLAPGYIVNKLYPHVSRMQINAVFFGQDRESEMVERVAEAVSRGWVAHFIANHDELKSIVSEAPVIKPSRLNDEELTFFSKSMVAAWRVMGEEEADHAVEREDIKEGRTNQIVSKSHKHRIRASKHQEIRVLTKDGQEKVFYGRKVTEDAKAVRLAEDELTSEEEEPRKGGRNTEDSGPKSGKGGNRRGRGRGRGRGSGRGRDRGGYEPPSDDGRPLDDEASDLGEHPLIDMDDIKSFQIYGRAQATKSEDARDMFILRLLEGRGALRGPEYEDCEFIRRIWFPNHAQIATGKNREAKHAAKNPKAKERYDWVEDSWGDDTDEEEAAHVLKNKVPDSELIDYDTEEDELGDDLQVNQVESLIPKLKGKINPSQLKVIGRVTAPNVKGRTRATLVHGPPGTGKTSTITAAAIRLVDSGEYVWIVAQSNVGISNVARKLRDIDFEDFILIVADEYYSWWETQYDELKPYVVRTKLLYSSQKRFRGKKLILCTLASLSNPGIENIVMYQNVPLRHLIIDEASQIDMTSEFMHLFFKHRYVLKNVCWFGDPMQLPPYGWSESAKINDIFKIEHLQANSKLMDTSYRLPIPIAEFISREVYKSELKAFTKHPVKVPAKAMLFVDTPKGEEIKETNGTSFMNPEEAKLIVEIVQKYYDKTDEATGEPYEFQIITPYEAQRKLVQDMLKQNGIERDVYNVDSFQGNEADYIITTLTKTTFSSFLSSVNRLNVLLTRCKRGLVVVSQKEFITRTGGLLRGLWWAYESHDIWKDAKEVSKGYVDLPGSPAPVERPDEESEEEGSESE